MIGEIHPLPAFADNYIWALRDSESAKFAVVDPGDPQPVLDYAAANNLQLSHILITHHHPDHTGGLGKLKQVFSPVVFGPEPSNIPGITRFLHEGNEIELFQQSFSIYEVPGHTLDHIAYFSDSGNKPVLFCGDTLFAAGCGRLFEGTPAMMLESLGKLTKLKPETLVYCTHEYTMANLQFALAAESDNQALLLRIKQEQARRDNDEPTLPSTIALELETNPFLRCQQAALINQVETYAGQKLDAEVNVFAALRSWKDNF